MHAFQQAPSSMRSSRTCAALALWALLTRLARATHSAPGCALPARSVQAAYPTNVAHDTAQWIQFRDATIAIVGRLSHLVTRACTEGAKVTILGWPGPTVKTVTALNCSAGHYCPLGSSVARPCSAGSFTTSTSLASDSECTPAPAGTFATTGSITATHCEKGTYSVPCQARTEDVPLSMLILPTARACLAGGAADNMHGHVQLGERRRMRRWRCRP